MGQVTPEHHNRFCELFAISPSRATFPEWQVDCPKEVVLTAPQWWRRVGSLKMTTQWLAKIRQILQTDGHTLLLESEDLANITPETDGARWLVYKLLADHIVDPIEFTLLFRS